MCDLPKESGHGVHATRESSKTHFQPAALKRQAYIFPMSPMPMIPMLFFASMVMRVRLN